MKKTILILLIMSSFFTAKSSKFLPTENEVDLNEYMGTWYEIARLPNKFEKGLECITANYSFREDGKIQVINKGHKAEERTNISEAKGKAWRPNNEYPGRLKVQFFWPFSGDYYIIHLDKDYQYVLVGSPSRKYLWILARTLKTIDQDIYNKLLIIAKTLGFEVEKMILVEHNCD